MSARALLRFVALLAALCAVVLWPAAAGAASLSVKQSAPRISEAADGGQAILVRATTRKGATCGLRVAVKKTSQKLGTLKAGKNGKVSWRWLILPSSRSGTWRLTVSCTADGRKVIATRKVVVVTSSKSDTGAIGDPATMGTPDGEPAGKGAGSGLSGCGPFADTYKQCTCLAWQKRQDVYNTAVAKGVPRGGPRLRAGGNTYYVWDGAQWLINAQRAGIPTGSTPVAGALVVWGTPNAATWGHIGYVERVESPTRILLTECNYNWVGDCRTIWTNPRARGALQGYIYGGPAGNGPGSSSTGNPGSGPTPETPQPPFGTGDATTFQAADGSLHVVINTGGGINHYVKGVGGSWGGEIVAAGTAKTDFLGSPSAFQAAAGSLHVVINTGGGINHYVKGAGGSWGGEIVARGAAVTDFLGSPSAFQGADGTLHVFINTGGGINHYAKGPGGSWGGEFAAVGSARSDFLGSPSAFHGADGSLHVVINTGGGINHYVKGVGGSWGGEIAARAS